MSETRLKKSETIEVRIPHTTKVAFMQKARSEGRAASDIVRERIDAYLGSPPRPEPTGATPHRALRNAISGHLGPILLLPAAIVGLLAMANASAPAAQPELRQAFAILDLNHDGALSRAEFVSPPAAHEVDLRGLQPGFDGVLAIGTSKDAGAYMRYLLLGPDGDVPLLIAVDAPPAGKTDDAQLAQLAGKTFDRLDGNGDGKLTIGEFERG